jgi:hypothetical protein
MPGNFLLHSSPVPPSLFTKEAATEERIIICSFFQIFLFIVTLELSGLSLFLFPIRICRGVYFVNVVKILSQSSISVKITLVIFLPPLTLNICRFADFQCFLKAWKKMERSFDNMYAVFEEIYLRF